MGCRAFLLNIAKVNLYSCLVRARALHLMQLIREHFCFSMMSKYDLDLAGILNSAVAFCPVLRVVLFLG